MSLLERAATWLGLAAEVPRRKHTEDVAITELAPPGWVSLARGGLAAEVAPGDAVRAGQLVLRSAAAARWQLRRHASVDGHVQSLDDDALVLAGTPPAAAVVTAHHDPGALAPVAIVDAAREAGLVGLGGAMFPTYAKLLPLHPVDTVIVNGCESEPYLTCDHRVLIEQRAEVECGMHLAMRALGAERGLVIEREAYYPAGYERFLVRHALGRQVPPRGLPRDVGAVVINVQSALALHHAVCLGRPLLSRVVTVAGEAVQRPGNFRVAIGTPVAHLLASAGFQAAQAEAVIIGGAMMGRVAEPGEAVGPGTGGILALTAAELAERAERPCLRCGRCQEACPVDLPVVLLTERPGPAALSCIDCGLCQFVCPSALPLVERMRRAKERELEWD